MLHSLQVAVVRRGRRSTKQRQEEEDEGEEEAGEQEAEEEEAPPSRRCAGRTLHSLVGSLADHCLGVALQSTASLAATHVLFPSIWAV